MVEGEPLELGELGYNVQLTRFLNPDDVEDSEYLVGLPEPDPGTSYLGVFLVIKNEAEEPLPSANEYVVHDTLDNEYEPLESESPFALEIGATVEPESQLPVPESTPATGPNQAALLDLQRLRRGEREPAAEAGDLVGLRQRRSRARPLGGRRRVPLRRLQALLIVTAAGAAVVLSGQFSTAVRAVALAVMLLGVALTYSERFRPGGGWWSLLAAGARALGRRRRPLRALRRGRRDRLDRRLRRRHRRRDDRLPGGIADVPPAASRSRRRAVIELAGFVRGRPGQALLDSRAPPRGPGGRSAPRPCRRRPPS